MTDEHLYWTKTWNPVTGCSPVSEGCENCYAMALARRFDDGDFSVKFHPERLDQPERWKKPQRVFVCNCGDLWHPEVGDQVQARVLATTQVAPRHKYLILTKRPENMAVSEDHQNVWFGVTCENQKRLMERTAPLFELPTENRWLSLEPLLGPIDLSWGLAFVPQSVIPKWVVVGCETGPKRRPCELSWIEDIVRQCREHQVPVWVKQVSINGKVSKNMDDWPPALRVREMPEGLKLEGE